MMHRGLACGSARFPAERAPEMNGRRTVVPPGRNREVPGDTPLAALLMIAPPELQTGTELKVQHHIAQASEFNIQYSTSQS